MKEFDYSDYSKIQAAAEKYVDDEWITEYETQFEEAFIAGAYYVINNLLQE